MVVNQSFGMIRGSCTIYYAPIAGYYVPIAGLEGNIYIFQGESAYDIGEREISVFRMVHFANL